MKKVQLTFPWYEDKEGQFKHSDYASDNDVSRFLRSINPYPAIRFDKRKKKRSGNRKEK